LRFEKNVEGSATKYRLEFSGRHRDGREFPVEITISGPIRSTSGDFFGAFLREISQRKEREKELRKAKEAAESYARTLETLNSISRELSGLLNTDDLLKRIGELLYQIVEYSAFSVLLLDPSGHTLEERFSFSGAEGLRADFRTEEGPVGVAARTRKPVVVGNPHSDFRELKFYDETQSELSVPLIAEDHLIGVLDIRNSAPNFFRAEHVQAITILASQLAVAIDNAILYERVSNQERQLNRDLQFARGLQKRLLPVDLPVMKNAAISTLSWP